MNKIALTIIIAGLVLGIGIVFLNGLKNNDINTNEVQLNSISNVEVRDGVQYITINAKGGYSPKVSNAKAGIPTKLIMKTNGTYDCSASLVVRPIGYQKILPKTGEETIDLGTPKAGSPIQGVCSMGMYSFKINFEN
jgi:plastocyanin domain-containing protein